MSDSEEQRSPHLDVLSVGPVGVTSPVEVGRARERMLPWLEQQVAEIPTALWASRRREQMRRATALLGGTLALAAATLLAFHWGPQETPRKGAETAEEGISSASETAKLVTGQLRSSSHTWLGGQEVALLGRLSAGVEGAALQADRGYQLELRPSSEVSFEHLSGSGSGGSDDARVGLHLHRGIAKVSVLPQPEGAELVVKTGDILLTVVKAAFTVEAGERFPSCVRVSEGEVVVRRGSEQRTVSSGGSYGCHEEQPPAIDASIPTVQKKRTTASRTTLPRENELLSRALSAESRGQSAEAVSAYQELLAKYPRSAFAQDARAGLDRLNR